MYNHFAYEYDKLMNDINYGKWADYIEKIFDMYGLSPTLILDLGCGTGSFCVEMAGRGYDLIGVDSSTDMLCCAKEKAIKAGRDILFLNQDMSSFELYGTVDVVVCLVDSLNYITLIPDIKRMFKLVANYLNPGGLFIFDINTEYKMSKVLGNNVFYDVRDDVSYIWQSAYDSGKKLCTFDVTFFAKQGELYRRYDEIHNERAYKVSYLKELLIKNGIETLGVYDGLSLKAVHPRTERAFFVCRKLENNA
jgi:SAM-dependent methyltransferase